MTHILNAFIVKEEDLSPFVRRKALPQEFALVPGDEWLLSQFPELEAKGTQGFSELLCGNKPVVAVFTDYFGGIGEQSAHFYDGKTLLELQEERGVFPGPIDRALEMLGVKRSATEDEFDAIGLGNYRDTTEVLGQPRDLKHITDDEVRELWNDTLSSRDATGKYSHFYPYADKWTSGAYSSTRVPGLTIYRGDGPPYVEPFYIDETGHYYMKADETVDVLEGMLKKMADTILAQEPTDESALAQKEKWRVKELVLADIDWHIRRFLARHNFYMTNTANNVTGI